MYIIWEFIWITHIIVTRIQGTFPTVLCNKFCDFAKFRVSFQLDDFVFKVGVSFACQENQKRQFFIKTLGFNFGCRKNPVPFFCFLIHGSFKWQSVGCFWVPRDSGIRWRWWQNNLEFSNFEWRCCCWAKGTVYDHNQSSCTWDSTPNWCAGRNNGPWRSRPFGRPSFRTRSSAGRSGDRTRKFITWFAGCWDPPLWIEFLCPHVADLCVVEADGSRMLPFKAPRPTEPVLPASLPTSAAVVAVVGLDALGVPLDEDHVCRAEIVIKVAQTTDKVTHVTPCIVGKVMGNRDLWCHQLSNPVPYHIVVNKVVELGKWGKNWYCETWKQRTSSSAPTISGCLSTFKQQNIFIQKIFLNTICSLVPTLNAGEK